jgi:hypothetical protein
MMREQFYCLCRRLLYLTQLLQLCEFSSIAYHKFEVFSKYRHLHNTDFSILISISQANQKYCLKCWGQIYAIMLRCSILLYVCCMYRPSHFPQLDRLSNILRSVQIIKFLAMQFSPSSCYFLSHLHPHILLSKLFRHSYC